MSSIFFFTKCGGQFCTLTPLPLSKFQKFQKKNQNLVFIKGWELKEPKSDPPQMSIKCSPKYIHNMCFSEINTVS